MADEQSMVERVARAICTEAPDRIGPFWTDDGRFVTAGQPAWTAWQEDARAAIAEMRDATSHQYAHGAQAIGAGGNVADAWKAMIDAALDEG